MDQGGNTVTAPSGNMGIWVRTAAETAAGVTPTHYAYAPGDLRRYGAQCDGETDDTAAIQTAYDALPATGGVLFIPSPSYIGTTAILWLGGNGHALKPCRITGAGFIGEVPAGAATAPVSAIGIWGSVGAPVAFGTAIASGTSTFNVANTFSVGDLLLLSNFPTDPGGSDAYTSGAPDIWGNSTRTYANESTANLRQTRRKELLSVESATSASFTTAQTTFCDYSSITALQFQQVSPAGPVVFDCDLANLTIYCKLARGHQFRGTLTAVDIRNECCFGYSVEPALFDAQQYDCRVDNYEGSRNFRLSGNAVGGQSSGDNGVFKALGCVDFSIDVSVSGAGTNYHGVMTDTNFGENWTGYTDLPCGNYVVRSNCQGVSLDVFAACDPYAATNGPATVNPGSTAGTVYLKGAANITVEGAPQGLRLDGVTGIDLKTNRLTYYFGTTISNPRNSAQVQSNTDVRGLWQPWTPTVQGDATAGSGTYSTQFGQYLRVGNRVSGNLVCNWTAHTGTGNIQINLPFEVSSGAQSWPVTVGSCYGGSGSGNLTQPLFCYAVPGETYALIYAANSFTQIAIENGAQQVSVAFDYIVNSTTGT